MLKITYSHFIRTADGRIDMQTLGKEMPIKVAAIEMKEGDTYHGFIEAVRQESRRLGATIDSIEADGEHMSYIQRNFKNIPLTTGRSCLWHGSDAMFIMNNLGRIE